MCRVHTSEELANILETMAGLFTWKQRKALVEAAEVARFPTRPWRKPSPTGPSGTPGATAPAYFDASEKTRPA